ncbi:hypothetical protein PPNK14_02330 [Pectobacterium parmentieri]
MAKLNSASAPFHGEFLRHRIYPILDIYRCDLTKNPIFLKCFENKKSIAKFLLNKQFLLVCFFI